MLKKTIAMIAFMMVAWTGVKADEGMWLLHLIKQNYGEMKKMGLRLTPEQIYSVNNSSLKDAVLTMNGGMCTGEMISKEGLFLTNHHCGYDAIQGFSTPEHDYLTDGFWAMKRGDEMHVPGMTVTYLMRIEDVTDRINEELSDDMNPIERTQKIEELKAQIAAEAVENTHYDAYVREFFEGSEFYLFVNETFRDVRLVGAPPSAVGKYGGDTDNWMWPRHTGDFSMFRVYAGADNKPADYSEDNKPFAPRHHFPVSLDGVQEDDFAMIMGYPGSTDRYLTSYGVQHAIEKDQPARVRIRRKKLDIMAEDMATSDAIRIMYASKYAQVSNYWKYFIGQSKQLANNNVYEKKKAQEERLKTWINANDKRKERYGDVFKDIESAYETMDKYWYGSTYLNECVFGPEINLMAFQNFGDRSELHAAVQSGDMESIKAASAAILEEADEHFKNYNPETDQKIFAAMLEIYYNDVPKELQPEMLKELGEKYAGKWDKYAMKVFKKSPFTSKEDLADFLNGIEADDLEKDPVIQLMNGFIEAYIQNVLMNSGRSELQLAEARRLMIEAYRKMNSEKNYYPDANSTLRLTYGKVGGYESSEDAVIYKYYTTAKGIMQKYEPGDLEFDLPADLIETLKKEDYGRYADDSGQLRVCFLTNNDITGGNSGSPVLNAEGHLIGCAFDGNWEAMSGDIYFEPHLQKTISVDIRYVLYIIDKYAGAGHLIEEMTLIETNDKPMQETERVNAPRE